MDPGTWEGVAADVLGEIGCDDPPVDALEVADLCGLTVYPAQLAGARLCGDEILVEARSRPVRLHGLVAHELGHFALRRAREADDEQAARYMSGAILLPRRALDRDLRVTWNPLELQRRHVNASIEMIARRICQLREAVASIWDDGRLRARVGPGKPSSLERSCADAALRSEALVRVDDRLWAVPVFTPGWRRVVVVARATDRQRTDDA